MKIFIKLLAISVVLLISFNTYAQVQDSIYYNRLFYTCKAWGHVKYYHSEVANGNVNWDRELLNAIEDIKNAPNNESFNQALLQLLNSAGDMRIGSSTLPEFPDSLNNNTDYSWIENAIFSDAVKLKLNRIKSQFRPQSHVLVDEAWAGGAPSFDNDNLYYVEQTFPSEGKKVLALFRYWNIINYFFPYKYIMDQDWDTTLVEFIPEIVESSDAISYHLAFKKLTASVNDSHAAFISPTYNIWLGLAFPPFLTRFIENEMVITKVLPEVTGVKVGDVIKAIDGEDIYSLRDSLRPLAHGSNDVIIERTLNSMIMRGNIGDFSITVDDGNERHTKTLTRNITNLSNLNAGTSPIWRDTTINDGCNFGIVDMGRLEISQVRSMFNDLWDTDAIIFDIRNYPNGTLWHIVNYLYPSSVHVANFTRPDITYPGRLMWQPGRIGRGTSDPYKGKVIILFDERTQSQAEYTCMGLEQFPNSTKIGSTTSGADGNIAEMFLPGKITVYATFLGTFYPDYTETQRVGIMPDYEVLPTISGIKEGKDEVMDFALKCELVDTKEIETTENIAFYPNPAIEEIRYDLGGENPTLFEIFDMQGRKVKAINANSSLGSIDISELNKGVYVIKVYMDDIVGTKLIVKN